MTRKDVTNFIFSNRMLISKLGLLFWLIHLSSRFVNSNRLDPNEIESELSAILGEPYTPVQGVITDNYFGPNAIKCELSEKLGEPCTTVQDAQDLITSNFVLFEGDMLINRFNFDETETGLSYAPSNLWDTKSINYRFDSSIDGNQLNNII